MMSSPGGRLALLLVGFASIIVIIGEIVNLLAGGGWVGFLVVLVVAAAATWAAYRKAPATVLAASGARPADPDEHPRLYNLVEGLSITAGVPEPDLYVIDDAAPNALVAGHGPDRAALAVTTGLLDQLDRIELEAVLAHQLSHIRNADLGVHTVAVTTAGLGVLVPDLAFRKRNDAAQGRPGPRVLPAAVGYPFLPVAPLSARLLAHTRTWGTTDAADLTGVAVTRYPPGLIAALEKIGQDRSTPSSGVRATAHLWFRDPVAETSGPDRPAIDRHTAGSHPPLSERIERLREL